MEPKLWSYRKFANYVMPSIISMVFISLYTIIDGLFVARYVGTNALAAINIVYPIYSIAFGFAIMMSTGGSTLISIALGAGKPERASNYFSLITLVLGVASVGLSIVGLMNMHMILVFLGATKELMPDSIQYGRIILLVIPFLSIKVCYEYFLRVDGQEKLSMVVTIIGGIINIVLDYLFIVRYGWGIAGAGYATAIGIIVSGMIGVGYFVIKPSHLYYVKPKMDKKFLLGVCINGSSEMVSELSVGIVAVFFNITILKFEGASGVAAISVLLYLYFIFIALGMGLTMGIQPAISYNYGAKQLGIIRDLLKKSMFIMIITSIVIFVGVQLFGHYSVQLFLSHDIKTFELANKGLRIFSIGLLFCSINILGSGYFTAINKGKISALISFSRSIVFIIPGILLLPKLFQLNGIWMTIPVAEVGTVLMTIFFFKKDDLLNRKNSLESLNYLKTNQL